MYNSHRHRLSHSIAPYYNFTHSARSFDGDGMIFACRISNGAVNFSNSYVDTNRLRQEKAAGHPLGLKVAIALMCHIPSIMQVS